VGVVDLNEMAVFARVVREGSFTRAAAALSLPKSTVSQRVARLEGRLGARLLHRTTRRVRPTDAGLVYFERCAAILADAEQADAAVSEAEATVRGRLRLCAPPLFGHTFLGPILKDYLREFPGTAVDVLLTDEQIDLVAQGFDLAVRVGDFADQRLVARPLGIAEHVLCATPRFLREHGTPRTPRDLQSIDCITYTALPLPTMWRLERGAEVQRVRVRGRLSVNSVPFAYRSALDGLGIGNLPAFMCARDLRAGRLARVLQGWSSARVALRVVYPTRQHVPERVRAMIQLIVARFGSSQPWAVKAR
jgi:DNA-binding transcriptional LysR family regulator